MPQFDFGTFPSQIFWLIVCFAALYFLLAKTVLPKIGAVLEDRPSPENVLGAVQNLNVTLLYSVATVYRRILAIDGVEDQYDLSTLRGCNATGEALEAEGGGG